MARLAGLIIGHEILTGKFADRNGPFLIERATALGARLERLVVLEDDLDAIATEVAACAASFDAVITTGGVGPTHDDITLEAVALGLGRELELNAELMALMEGYGIEPNEANKRMATLPRGSTLVRTRPNAFPVVRCDNVWVFPGVPALFQKKFRLVEAAFMGERLHQRRVVLLTHETAIAARLTAVAADHPDAIIGSYPRFEEEVPTVILTIESTSEAVADGVVTVLQQTFAELLA